MRECEKILSTSSGYWKVELVDKKKIVAFSGFVVFLITFMPRA